MAGDAHIIGAPGDVFKETQEPAVVIPPMGMQFQVAVAPQEPGPTHPAVDGTISFETSTDQNMQVQPMEEFTAAAPNIDTTVSYTQDGITTVVTNPDVSYNAENASLNLQSSPVCDLFDVGCETVEATFTNTHQIAGMQGLQPVPQVPDQQPPIQNDWETTYTVNEGPALNA